MTREEALPLASTALARMGQPGALLIAGEQKPNILTIGWGSVGVYWRKPVFVAPIRMSRYTHALLDMGKTFTVSIPRPGEMKELRGYCGSRSGRDVDKLAEGEIKTCPGQAVALPVVADCALYLECRVVARTVVQEDEMTPGILEDWYGGGDVGNVHELFFGEILACYEG